MTTAPTKKRTKKADTRVAELEKKVNELTARLGDDAVASYAYASHPPLPDGAHGVDFADSTRPEKRRRTNDQHDALVSSAHLREKSPLIHGGTDVQRSTARNHVRRTR